MTGDRLVALALALVLVLVLALALVRVGARFENGVLAECVAAAAA
ncbi:hypothetical protein [Kitasatospora griseola]